MKWSLNHVGLLSTILRHIPKINLWVISNIMVVDCEYNIAAVPDTSNGPQKDIRAPTRKGRAIFFLVLTVEILKNFIYQAPRII